MKFTVYLALVTYIILSSYVAPQAQAQINIGYPTNRTVLQRDKNNTATISIRGTYTQPVDRVEAQLRALNGGNTSNWMTIQTNPQGGLYSGQIDWNGGWYEMEVRGWLGDKFVGSSTVSRLGIGEVFIVVGQSNAQGYFNYGAPGANDDRVNCINYYNSSSSFDLPTPEFSHLNSDSYISPRGNSAWAWGRLGDHIVSRLGVPVLFYNAGWYSSASTNWRESINGTAYSLYSGEAFVPSGMPYGNLRLALQYYISISGLRGIIWQQGEADNFGNKSTSQYYNDLKTVIEQSRNETGRNISWVIARSSFDNMHGSNPAIIKAQNDVIATVSNTFYGPETDQIQTPRPDGAHFQDQGLYQLADVWNSSLNDDFFNRSEPSKATSQPRIQATCNSDNTLTLTVDGGNYTSINWNNGQNSSNIRVGRGSYYAKVRDGSGNILFTPTVVVPDRVLPQTPTINLDGGNMICQGSSISLTASTSENIRWNTGETGQRITTSTANTFTVTTTSVYGCSATSAPISVGVFSSPPPPRPAISVNGSPTFCAGGSVVLKSNSSVNSLWSDGRTGATISVDRSGDYRVKAVDSNGCQSQESDLVRVQVNPLPAKPVITANRSTTFCFGENVTLTSSYTNGNNWNTNNTGSAIVVSGSGDFTVSVTDGNGCKATSDVVMVQVNPLPPAPTITALRPTTFCQRDYTVLQSSASSSYQWSTGDNQREVEIRAIGEYSLVAIDANGCRSPSSASVKVQVNPLPPRPTIQVIGSTTFCADQTVTLRAPNASGYSWNNGKSSQEITINQADSYEVRTKNEFGCNSDPSDRVVVQVLPLPAAPTIVSLGPTTFCQGEQVQLRVNGNGSFFWNTGATGQTISAGESGNYSARIQGSNGCYSPYSQPIRLQAKPSPAQPTIMQVGTFTLQADNNIPDGKFIWNKDGQLLAEPTFLLKATQPGAYSVYSVVQYSVELSCVSEESAIFNFFPEVGKNGISIYPNPSAEGIITLETRDDFAEAMVLVYDMSGKIVQSFPITNLAKRKFLDLSLLSNGVYIIKVTSMGFSATQKLMISH